VEELVSHRLHITTKGYILVEEVLLQLTRQVNRHGYLLPIHLSLAEIHILTRLPMPWVLLDLPQAPTLYTIIILRTVTIIHHPCQFKVVQHTVPAKTESTQSLLE
jgi:hypothetical protein